jgi:HlyD family secretion protein
VPGHARNGSTRRSLAAALLVATAASAQGAANAGPAEAHRGEFVSQFLLGGELAAEDAMSLVVPNANIWPVQVRWLAEDGVEVQAGDTLVEFDNSQLASQLEQLERAAEEAANQLASLAAETRSQVLEAEFELEQKEAELEKAKLAAAVPSDLLALKEYEKRQLDLDRAALDESAARDALTLKETSGRARVAKQEVELRKAEAAAQRARDGIAILTLEAPRAGILLVSDNEEEGRTFQTGDNTWPGTTIARLPDLSSMIVEAWLYDVDDGRVTPGQRVTAVVDAFPDTTLEGEVIDVDNIAKEITRGSPRRAFRTRLRLAGLDVERMRPGMSVRVMVETRLPDVLLLPRAALTWRPAAGGPVAEARGADGELHAVTLGPCNAVECVVLDESVPEGQAATTATEAETEAAP